VFSPHHQLKTALQMPVYLSLDMRVLTGPTAQDMSETTARESRFGCVLKTPTTGKKYLAFTT